MWKNYLKMSFRSLLKQKMFSLLNLTGLSLGIGVAGLLFLYVLDEITYDKYHQNLDQIFRVIVNVEWDGQTQKWANAPNAVGPEAVRNISGVNNQVRFLHHNFGEMAFIQAGDQNFTEKQLYWSDPSLLNIFDIPMINKISNEILAAPNQVILSESSAQKYFGSIDPIGKLIKVDNSIELEIVGIYKDLPSNSSFFANMIGSFATMSWAKNLSWGNSSFETFLLLESGALADDVEKSLAIILNNNVEKNDQWYSLSLQPLTEVHLHSDYITNTYISRTGDSRQIRILLYLALIIIAIACINYMSLATSKSQQRLKEVGINKTIGATRKNLITRFYLETAVMVLISMIFSLLFLALCLPIFNQIADKNIATDYLTDPMFLAGLAALALVISLVSGAYPAIYLSSFSPGRLLANQNTVKFSGNMIRKGLVVVQFVASIIIIISTVVFYNQLRFIQNKNLGYNPEMVIGIHTAGSENNAQTVRFMDQLNTLPSIKSVAHAQSFPGNGGSGYTISKPEHEDLELPVEANRTTPEILNVLSIELLAGKTLPDREVTRNDSIFQVVLNEKAVSFLGYSPQEAIGKEASGLFYNAKAFIVGVVRDFHFESFRQPIGGYVFHNRPSERKQYALVKIESKDLSNTLGKIQSTFSQTIPTSAFEYSFLDQQLENLYFREKRTARIFLIFAFLSIFIACLGLFGLTAFTIERRTKEIGIRKILGASASRITTLLSLDFLRLVLIAIFLSIPVSLYLMNNWLQNFAFRTNLSIWNFVLAGVCAIVIALLTVSLQGLRAALTNPVNSLRNE